MKKDKNKIEDIEDKEVEKKEIKVKKSNKTRNIIIILVVIFSLYFLLPSITILGTVFFDIFDNTKYIESNNSIIVDNGEIILKDIKGYYDTNTKEYIVYGYIDNVNKNYTIDIEYNVYDSNNFVIGTAYTSIDMKKGESYKFKAIYYEADASEVVNYKIKDINLY